MSSEKRFDFLEPGLSKSTTFYGTSAIQVIRDARGLHYTMADRVCNNEKVITLTRVA
jgi:hypothetical protein